MKKTAVFLCVFSVTMMISSIVYAQNTISHDLRFGDSGQQVLQLQRLLQGARYFSTTANSLSGKFDLTTQNNIKALQRINDLPVTGVVDSATLKEINYLYRQNSSQNVSPLADDNQKSKTSVAYSVSYPYIRYIPLSSNRLRLLQQEFIKRNGPEWRIELDEYGFVKRASVPLSKNIQDKFGQGALEDSADAWSKFIIYNKDFFGLSDSDSANFHFGKSDLGETGSLTAFQIFKSFPNFNLGYKSDGRTFTNDQMFSINIAQRSGVVFISNHFWPQTKLPTEPNFTVENIGGGPDTFWGSYTEQYDSCVGGSCTESGPQRLSVEIPLKKSDFQVVLQPHLSPVNKMLELRLVYHGESPSYERIKYFDAMTGKVLPF